MWKRISSMSIKETFEFFFFFIVIIIIIIIILDTDICKPNPCLHAGTCQDLGDTFKCECKMGFKGRHCEGDNID